MEKANVIKALEVCGTADCNGCPYEGMPSCDRQMCNDAIALLKTNNAPKYTMVIIYTKKGNLLPYLTGTTMDNRNINTTGSFEAAKAYYARERSLELIAMFRFDKGKTFCKIKCPVNPLPVKGEFEVPSFHVLDRFLKGNDWSIKQRIYPRMFE